MKDLECDEERQLRRLLAQVAELPRTVEPPRDLWPGVAARLEQRQPSPRTGAEAAEAHHLRRPGRERGWTARRWLVQAAAAVVFMALGAAMGRMFPAPDGVPDGGPPSAVAFSGFEAVEAEYLRAKDAMWLVAASRRDELSPVTMETVQRNLVVLDEAIWDLRRALAADPGNRHLEDLLLAQHRRGLDLLRRLTARSA